MNPEEAVSRRRLLHTLERVLEGPMVFLGFVWLALLVVELVWGLTRPLEYLSITIWVAFIFDFLLKFLLATHKMAFLRKNWLTVLSLIIPAIRLFSLLRLLRSLRGLRLIKVVGSLNRGMKSLAATMKRRGFAYVLLLTLAVIFGGAAGLFAIERGHPGFESYAMALWFTAMRVITAGSDYWPTTSEGRGLTFLLALYGYGIFGYITATLATFFIGRDAEADDAEVAGAKDVAELKELIRDLVQRVQQSSKPDGSREN